MATTPVVSSIAPTNGPAAGGTIVTVTGSGFTGAVAVGFGTANAASLTVASDTQVIAISPPGSGTVNVTVIGPGGQSAVNLAAQFAYAAAATASSSGGPYYVDPALSSQVVGSLLTMLQNTTSPAMQEAQAVLMRRLALQGDVIGSRVPPPLNITQIGGYLNLLATLKEGAMREQVLAGILGVAGPTSALGWIDNDQPLSMVSIVNDRPAGPAQPTLPVNVLVRSDFLVPLQAAAKALHAQGATLPLSGPPAIMLPPGAPGATPPADILPYLGRVLTLAPAAALLAPDTDPFALVRASGGGSSVPFAPAANAINPATNPVTPANYDALQCNATACSPVPLVNAFFVPLGPVLAAAGFYQVSPQPQPANLTDASWTRFTNITGLVSGTTKLGDELALLYDSAAIAQSVFAAMQNAVWNGTTFA